MVNLSRFSAVELFVVVPSEAVTKKNRKKKKRSIFGHPTVYYQFVNVINFLFLPCQETNQSIRVGFNFLNDEKKRKTTKKIKNKHNNTTNLTRTVAAYSTQSRAWKHHFPYRKYQHSHSHNRCI